MIQCEGSRSFKHLGYAAIFVCLMFDEGRGFWPVAEQRDESKQQQWQIKGQGTVCICISIYLVFCFAIVFSRPSIIVRLHQVRVFRLRPNTLKYSTELVKCKMLWCLQSLCFGIPMGGKGPESQPHNAR